MMDCTAYIIGYLGGMGHEAFGTVPNPRPDEFVTVERVGGPATLGIEYPSFAIQVWAQSQARCAEVMDFVVGELLDMPDGVACSACEIDSITRFDDESGQPRWQCVLDSVFYR